MALYGARSAVAYASHRGTPGKDLVVVSTAVCWHLGIVTFNSDYAFTVTNVLIHGIPYLVLTYWYARRIGGPTWLPRSPGQAVVVFLSTVWLLAYAEELLWDRTLWHDRNWLFGSGFELEDGRALCLALLATPQITHYVLDGFLWRRAGNPQLNSTLQAALPETHG
ncbi:MAG: hypothetical protein B7Z55_17490 [Planctomycetales bacterium 12-60-4]|nr:MAG: hypothetical protein B7Z55_17490 [Planctomycetales bacterium 12-60-4]